MRKPYEQEVRQYGKCNFQIFTFLVALTRSPHAKRGEGREWIIHASSRYRELAAIKSGAIIK